MKAAYVGDHFDTKRIAVALKMAEIINFKDFKIFLKFYFSFLAEKYFRQNILFSKPADLISTLCPCLHFYFIALF
jgi:hypothetical protein